MVLVLAVEEAPGSVAAFLSNLQNDVELCVTFVIFTEFNSWFDWLGFSMGEEFGNSSTVTGMSSFSVSFGVLGFSLALVCC